MSLEEPLIDALARLGQACLHDLANALDVEPHRLRYSLIRLQRAGQVVKVDERQVSEGVYRPVFAIAPRGES